MISTVEMVLLNMFSNISSFTLHRNDYGQNKQLKKGKNLLKVINKAPY